MFDNIHKELQQMLSCPDPYLPIELIHNNEEVAKIVGTAYVVEQHREEAPKERSEEGAKVASVAKRNGFWNGQEEAFYDRREGRY